MNTVYIAFGSNLDTPIEQIKNALLAVGELGNLTATSPLYASKAIGPGSQPDYINGVCLLETQLKPNALLTHLQAIEDQQGRVRSVKNSARTLDLDILLFNQIIQNLPHLIIPHPRMTERNFVIFPLSDIAPELNIPPHGSIFNIKQKLDTNGLKQLDISV